MMLLISIVTILFIAGGLLYLFACVVAMVYLSTDTEESEENYYEDVL